MNDISLVAPTGRILGLLGKNGAGKTTLFHSILQFITYEGQITWNQQPLTEKTYDQIGYLPEERSLITKLTVYEQVKYLANLKNMNAKKVKEELPRWLERLQVRGKATDKISKLSKGNQQKIQLICTLIHRPKLIILDEPFSGLDPVNVEILRKTILAEKKRGATIIFSDHNMNSVESLCDDLALIHRGKLKLQGPIQVVRESFGETRILLRTSWSLAQLQALPHVLSVEIEQDHYKLIIDDPQFGPEIYAAVSQGQFLKGFYQQPPTLTEIFKQEVEA
ncbi:ABC transporter ATP-binding protein [Bombilactobacillus apium]|uniref:ABC transporter ATP-binding protein n=1 Tax=Bombilactobacillus apium TaxID=2675299 RepID=UPI001E305B6E|nr:ATP-binding cassette domain-containing protein [Bombilactobacillus apium]